MSEVTGGQPQREPSFTDRKAAQLRQERGVREEKEEREQVQPEPIRKKRAPEPELESAVTEPEYGDEEDIDTESVDDEYEDSEDPDDGAPDDDDGSEEDEDDGIDWRRRYQEAEKKISEVTANRSAMEREHADVMATTLSLRHNLEDTYTEARRYADQYKVAFDTQIGQLEQAFSTGQISPEHLPGARQQYQNLVNQRNMLVGQVEQLTEREREAKKIERERKAEIARVRLARTIPNWSREKHRELGEYAMSRGFSQEEFSENLDYRFLEILNDSMQLRSASDKVKQVRRKKKGYGPKRNAAMPERGTDGKFRKAQADFRNNPNQRGRFAEMKLQQLRKEPRR